MISNKRETSSAESAKLEILNWDGENPTIKSMLQVGAWQLKGKKIWTPWEGVKNAADAFFIFRSASKAENLIIHVGDQNWDWVGSRSQWPKFGWENMSVTRIWLWVDFSVTKSEVYSLQNSGHWLLLPAKFWSLMFPHSRILVTDFYSHPNCGHTDVSWATCITRI